MKKKVRRPVQPKNPQTDKPFKYVILAKPPDGTMVLIGIAESFEKAHAVIDGYVMKFDSREKNTYHIWESTHRLEIPSREARKETLLLMRQAEREKKLAGRSLASPLPRA